MDNLLYNGQPTLQWTTYFTMDNAYKLCTLYTLHHDAMAATDRMWPARAFPLPISKCDKNRRDIGQSQSK
jgi:hypothetical protein